jgi:toxin ParE1/3/4
VSRLEFALRAQQDLQEIYDCIADDNLQAALQVIEQIEKRCQLLANNPGTGRKRDELIVDMRSAAIGNYLIFYFFFADGIEVTRIIHRSRDTEQIFDEPE